MAIAFVAASSEYIQATSYKGILGTNPRTVSAWIKTTALNAAIFSWGNDSNGERWGLRVQDGNGLAGAIRVEVNGGYIVGNVAVNDGEWHHVAATWEDDGTPDVTDTVLYVDGVAVGTSASTGNVINTVSGEDVKIGVAQVSSHLFDGLIDDARIYDRVLSAEEMATIFARRGSDEIVYGLVSRWKMLEGYPTQVVSGAGVVKDHAGANNGTPVNSPTWEESVITGRRKRRAA